MTAIRDSGGTLRTLSATSMRDAGATLRAITSIKMRDADNVLQTLSGGGALSVGIGPLDLYGYGYSAGSIYVNTSGSASVSVVGGVPPYTFTWTFTDVDWAAVSPGAQVTQMRSPLLSSGEEAFTTVYATVEDANGATADTNSINVYCTNVFGG